MRLNFIILIFAMIVNPAISVAKPSGKKTIQRAAQSTTLTIEDFVATTGFKPGEYYDANDNEECLGGSTEVLASNKGTLTLKVGERLLVMGIGKDKYISDYSERDCKITNTVTLAKNKLTSLVETSCKNKPLIVLNKSIEFVNGEDSKINYVTSFQKGYDKPKNVQCSLVKQ